MKLIPGLLFCLLATVAVTAERSPALDRILALHAEAVGPSLQSIEVDLTITEPGFTVTANYVARRDGRMRIDVFADGNHVFTEALDGDEGWQWNLGDAGPAPLGDAGREALRRGLVGNLYGLHEREALGYTLSYEGDATLDGTRYWQLRSVAPDGFEEILYLDRETAVVARRREVSALHPDLDPAELPVETRFSDFRRLEGRLIGFRSEKLDLASGERLQQTVIGRVVVNPALDDSRFLADAS